MERGASGASAAPWAQAVAVLRVLTQYIKRTHCFGTLSVQRVNHTSGSVQLQYGNKTRVKTVLRGPMKSDGGRCACVCLSLRQKLLLLLVLHTKSVLLLVDSQAVCLSILAVEMSTLLCRSPIKPPLIIALAWSRVNAIEMKLETWL